MSDIFQTFSNNAFRVESLEHYRNSDGSESEGYAAWVSGEPMPRGFNAEWVKIVQSALSRGARIRRLRLVSTPLSSYEEYELRAGYEAGIAAGEEIRVASRSELAGVPDAWFFDSERVIHQVYDSRGAFVRGEETQMIEEDRANLSLAVQLFERSPSVSAFLKE